MPAHLLITVRREVAVRGLPTPDDLIGRVNNPEVRTVPQLRGTVMMQSLAGAGSRHCTEAKSAAGSCSASSSYSVSAGST
jgi:hypothetical protein